VGGAFGRPFAMEWSAMRRVIRRTGGEPSDAHQDPVGPLTPSVGEAP
jgi:hypothetical protein